MVQDRALALQRFLPEVVVVREVRVRIDRSILWLTTEGSQ